MRVPGEPMQQILLLACANLSSQLTFPWTTTRPDLGPRNPRTRLLSLSLSLSLSLGGKEEAAVQLSPPARERAPAVHGICSYPLWDSPIEAQLYRNEVWAVGVPRWSQQNNRIGSYWSPNAEHLQTKRKTL